MPVRGESEQITIGGCTTVGSGQDECNDDAAVSASSETSTRQQESDPQIINDPVTLHRDRWLAEICEYCGKRQGYVLGLKGLGLRQRGHVRRCMARRARRTGTADRSAAASFPHPPASRASTVPSLGQAGSQAPYQEDAGRVSTATARGSAARTSVYFTAISQVSGELQHDRRESSIHEAESLRLRLKALLDGSSADGRLREACKDAKRLQMEEQNPCSSQDPLHRAGAPDICDGAATHEIAGLQSTRAPSICQAAATEGDTLALREGAFRDVGNAAPHWSTDLTHMLGHVDSYSPDEDLLLDSNLYMSVSSVVQLITDGVIAPVHGYCIVLSRSQSAYFLVYRSDKIVEVCIKFQLTFLEADDAWQQYLVDCHRDSRSTVPHACTDHEGTGERCEGGAQETVPASESPNDSLRKPEGEPFVSAPTSQSTPVADEATGRLSAGTQMRQKMAERRRLVGL